MEAIVELFVALFLGFLELLSVLVEAALGILALVAEFLLLAVTEGVSAASQRFKQRQQARTQRVENSASHLAPKTDFSEGEISEPHSWHKKAIVAAVLLLATGVGVVTWAIHHRIQVQRIEATRIEIECIADKYVEVIKDERLAGPKPGLLTDKDAWDQPLELFVDDLLPGSLVVVRSNGPDRKTGSIDDLLAIRVVPASAREVGAELIDRGLNALQDRMEALLPMKDDEKSNNVLDIGKLPG